MSQSTHGGSSPRPERSPDRRDGRRPRCPSPRALDIGKERDPETWEPPVNPVPEVVPAPEPLEAPTPAPVPAHA
jgi:hypothetical protein